MELVTEIWWQEGLLIQRYRTEMEGCVHVCKRVCAERMLAICNTRWLQCSKVPNWRESTGESSYLGGNKRKNLQKWVFDGLYDTLQRQIRDVWDAFRYKLQIGHKGGVGLLLSKHLLVVCFTKSWTSDKFLTGIRGNLISQKIEEAGSRTAIPGLHIDQYK